MTRYLSLHPDRNIDSRSSSSDHYLQTNKNRKKIVHPQQWPISINRVLSRLEHPKGHKLCSRQKKKGCSQGLCHYFQLHSGDTFTSQGRYPLNEVPLKKEVRKHHFNWGDNTGIYPMTVQFCQDNYSQ